MSKIERGYWNTQYVLRTEVIREQGYNDLSLLSERWVSRHVR